MLRIKYAEVPVELIKGKIVRNPNYGGESVSLNNWCWIEVLSTTRKPKFQEALRDSIKAEGFRNPIVVYSLPEGVFISFGQSRLRAARDLGLERIPAIVNDYSERFVDGENVTELNWTTYFRDIPSHVEFTDNGFDYHYGLERKRRHMCDEGGLAWIPDRRADFLAEEFPWVNE